MPTARDEITELLARNKDALNSVCSLQKLFNDTVQDLVAAGMDRATVAEAIFGVGCTWKLVIEGKHETISQLRAVASYVERQINDAPRH